MPRVEKLTLVIVGIALVALAVGYLLTEMGVSVTPTIPFYAPFLSVFNIVFLIAGFILIVFDNELDEFILALKMKALKYSITFTVFLLTLNQLVYFWGNPLDISATFIISLELWAYYIVFKFMLYREGLYVDKEEQ